MQLGLLTATSLAVLVATTSSHAAEVNEQGAKDIKRAIEKSLPKASTEAGSLQVKSAGTRYEIVYDFDKLLKALKIPGLVLRGLEPFSTFATPRDDGMWDLESQTGLDISGSFKEAGNRTEFTYFIGSMATKALFDPAISYVRSGDFQARTMKVETKTGETESATITIDSAGQTLVSTDTPAKPGRSDITATGKMSGIHEVATAKDMPPFDLRIGSMDIDVKADAVPVVKLRDLIVFLLDRKEQKALTPSETERLKSLIGETFPLTTAFRENIVMSDMTASSGQLGSGGAGRVGYHFSAEGPSEALRLGFGMEAQTVKIDVPQFPEAYKGFLPDVFEFELVQPGLNFAAFSDRMMDLDPKGSEAHNKDISNEAMLKLVPGNEVTVEMPKARFVASAYDVEVKGSGQFGLPGNPKSTVQATVLARDLDRTIAAVQEIGKLDPQANQASFALMMAKGFAKTDADGRSRWDIGVATDGSITVNGQVVKEADAPAPTTP